MKSFLKKLAGRFVLAALFMTAAPAADMLITGQGGASVSVSQEVAPGKTNLEQASLLGVPSVVQPQMINPDKLQVMVCVAMEDRCSLPNSYVKAKAYKLLHQSDGVYIAPEGTAKWEAAMSIRKHPNANHNADWAIIQAD